MQINSDNSAVIARLERQRDELAEALRVNMREAEILLSGKASDDGESYCFARQIGQDALANLDSEPVDEIRQGIRDFIEKQGPLDADVKRVISENMDELVIRDDGSAPAD